jgi:hypothetical protein
MKLRAIALSIVLALMSGVAFARHCPQDMAKIDAALAKNPTLTEAQMSEVKKLRKEGEDLHKAGKHPESEATLAKAMNILGVK